jgi:hypothetical protein
VPWTLRQGDEFELLLGPDDDNNGRRDRVTERRKFRLASTGQEVPFRIAGRSQVVVEIRRLSPGSRRALLADAAVTAEDVQFRPEFERIDVAVHNIGAAAARRVTVALLNEDGKELGRQTIPHLPAALDLNPQVVRVGFPVNFAGAARRKFTAVVDPDHHLSEITTVNNRATAVCPDKLAPRKIHSNP